VILEAENFKIPYEGEGLLWSEM